jgi:hypothetical protein
MQPHRQMTKLLIFRNFILNLYNIHKSEISAGKKSEPWLFQTEMKPKLKQNLCNLKK